MGYYIDSQSAADGYISEIKNAQNTDPKNNFKNAMNNSINFISTVRPYFSSSALPSLFDLDEVPANPYAPYIQSDDFLAEGYTMTRTPLKTDMCNNLVNSQNLVLVTNISLVSYWNQSVHGYDYLPRLTSYIVPDNIPEDRLVAHVNGASAPPSGSGGSAAPQPVPFVIGPGWHTFNYRGLNTLDGQWEYIEAPNPSSFITHGKTDRKATIYILDKQGTVHYSTTSFIITSMSKGHMTGQSKIPTFDKDILFFFKEKSRAIEVRGALLNSEDYDIARAWQTDWETHLSGAVTTSNKTRFYMLCAGWVMSGNLIGYRISKNAQRGRFADALTFTIQVERFEPLPEMEIIERSSGQAEAWKSKGETATPSSYLKGKGIKYLRPGQTLTEAKTSFKEEAPENTPEGKEPSDNVPPGIVNDSVV